MVRSPDVSSLDELDNYVDIDDYYRRICLPAGDHDAAELRYAVGEEIGRQLARLRAVPGTSSGDGQSAERRTSARRSGMRLRRRRRPSAASTCTRTRRIPPAPSLMPGRAGA